jgi:predicted O-linked N-acetylglucosamine transferase (SPINDLY family)
MPLGGDNQPLSRVKKDKIQENQARLNRLTTPLFDTKRFTRHIEAAYTMMYERHQAGLAPDHIIVPN